MRTKSRRALVFAVPIALAIAAGPLGVASHGPPGTQLWGYSAGAPGPITNYDIGTDTAGPTCLPTPGGNGRGIALDPFDGNLWYTFVDAAFDGDGLIHKAGTPPTCTSFPDIPFGDGPGGTDQDDIGAIDIDPDDGHLWVAGYQPIGVDAFLYKVDRGTGAIIQSCSVLFGGGGVGNDTLTVAKLPGLGGSGKYLLTDAGEPLTSPTDLRVVDASTCTGGGAGTIVDTINKVVPMSGIDYEGGKLIATDLFTIYDLGGYPFQTVGGTMPTGDFVEDITLETAPIFSLVHLTPTTEENVVGTEHTVTARVVDPNGNPVAGVLVTFTVTAGPNTGETSDPGTGECDPDDCRTGPDGNVSWTYTSNGTVGTDTIQACAEGNGCIEVTKTWIEPPECSVRGLLTEGTLAYEIFGTEFEDGPFSNPVHDSLEPLVAPLTPLPEDEAVHEVGCVVATVEDLLGL